MDNYSNALALVSALMLALPASAGPKKNGYDNFASPNRHQFAMVTTPHPVRYGKKSERYELRADDCGHDDCGNQRLRSELALKASRIKARFNKDIWYGWSFYNANIPSFSGADNLFVSIGQWKMGGPNRAIIMLGQLGQGDNAWNACGKSICSKVGGRSSDDIYIVLDDLSQVVEKKSSNNWLNVCRLFGMKANMGRWVDIVINTNFSTGNDGYLNVWIDDQLRCNYRGPLVISRDHTWYRGPDHRRGIYTRHTGRWDKRPNQAYPGIVKLLALV